MDRAKDDKYIYREAMDFDLVSFLRNGTNPVNLIVEDSHWFHFMSCVIFHCLEAVHQLKLKNLRVPKLKLEDFGINYRKVGPKYCIAVKFMNLKKIEKITDMGTQEEEIHVSFQELRKEIMRELKNHTLSNSDKRRDKISIMNQDISITGNYKTLRAVIDKMRANMHSQNSDFYFYQNDEERCKLFEYLAKDARLRFKNIFNDVQQVSCFLADAYSLEEDAVNKFIMESDHVDVRGELRKSQKANGAIFLCSDEE